MKKSILLFLLITTLSYSQNMPFNILCWGDSLTAGAGGNGTTYPKTLQTLLGSLYSVQNFGVGGENSLGISARQGGIPVLLKRDVTLPATTDVVIIGDRSDSGIISSWNSSNIRILLQGGHRNVNNCFIQNIECKLNFTGGSDGFYTLRRVHPADSETLLPASSEIKTFSSLNDTDEYANIFFIGQNGGWSNPTDLVNQYNALIDFSENEKYLIVGLTSGTATSRKTLETVFVEYFKEKYINMRAYLSEQGLQDAGITPTQQDLEYMQEGKVPPSLLVDNVHFNATGYKLIAKKVHERFIFLYGDNPLSTQNTEKIKNDIIIYPNPIQNSFKISTKTPISKINLLDTSGKVILNTSNDEVSITSLQKGVYYVCVTFIDNQVTIKKIIKK